MKHTTRAVRRFAASVTFAAVAGGLALPLLATPAGAVQDTEIRRLQGDDRYGTAAAVATDTFPDGADSVVLATGEVFADALAANGLAGALDAPVLLTTRSSLPATTIEALDELDPDTIYLMGGTSAVSEAVEDALAEDYTVERVFGDDRYETAAAAGAAMAGTGTGLPIDDAGIGSSDDGVTAVLASGRSFPDAVSAGPVAFVGRFPVLLTEASTIPAATVEALEDLEIEHILIIGGTAVIDDSVKAALEAEGYSTDRLFGDDRYRTNVAVNDWARSELGFGGETAYLSTGRVFADALAGGPAAGVNTAPLLLVDPAILPTPIRNHLVTHANAIDEIVAIGGRAAIADSVVDAAAAAAKLESNKAFAVTPTDDVILPPSTLPITNEGSRSFTATDLEPDGDYVIALLDASTVDPSGGVTFSSYSLASGDGTSIEMVNGQPVGAAGLVETVQEEATANDQGVITFTVDATSPDSIYPIVFEDLDDDGELTLAGQVADEPFGIGGKTTWLPAEAADGTYNGLTVTAADTSANYFVARSSTQSSRTFLYDPADRFRSEGTTITPAQFEGLLTPGDVVTIDYFQDAQSLYDVTTDTLPGVSAVTASTPNLATPNTVQVSWNPSAQPDALYRVYRDNGNGEFDDADVLVSPTGPSTTREFVEPASTTARRYLVVIEGATSGAVSAADADGDAFLSNAIVPGQAFFGLTEGTTVSKNAGLSLLNAGDEWMLHFSRPVQVAPAATITVREDGGNQVTLTNGTNNSTWVAQGSTVTITLGTGANAAPDIAYGQDTEVIAISGIADAGGTAITLAAMRDVVLEDDGPELMPESTTCDPGDTSCTIAFNEPVSRSSAEFRPSYDYNPQGGGRFLTSVSLGSDGRTITMSFSPSVGAGDRLAPRTTLSAVNDDDGQASNQAPFIFVR